MFRLASFTARPHSQRPMSRNVPGCPAPQFLCRLLALACHRPSDSQLQIPQIFTTTHAALVIAPEPLRFSIHWDITQPSRLSATLIRFRSVLVGLIRFWSVSKPVSIDVSISQHSLYVHQAMAPPLKNTFSWRAEAIAPHPSPRLNLPAPDDMPHDRRAQRREQVVEPGMPSIRLPRFGSR